MKQQVRSFRFFGAWEYEKEIQVLNEASERGLQLVRGGCFHSVFQRDDQVRYIYQLDFNPKLEDKCRYVEMFAEQGWEYVNSTFNGWHYFRKQYREGMEADEMEIYTDRQSLIEMRNRWSRIIGTLSVIAAVMSVLYFILGISRGAASIILEAMVFAVMAVSFRTVVVNEKRVRAGEKEILVVPLRLTLAAVIILFVLAWMLA